MDQRDIEQLLRAGEVTSTVKSGDIFLLARPNVQRGDQYSLLTIKEEDLVNYFVGQVPTPFALPYKVYTALLTQSGNAAPTANVLQNTLGGDIVWTYNSPGFYFGTLVGAFGDGTKVFISTRPISSSSQLKFIGYSAFYNDADTIFLNSYKYDDATTTHFLASDNILGGYEVEIRVYN